MAAAEKATIICVTPVKNEEWILERFCRCASMWADCILLADQQSTDQTREIASQFSRVRLIDNPTPRYDEAARQQLLLTAARSVPLVSGTTKRLIIALDADEALTANFQGNAEWRTVQAAAPGTVICFNWVNVLPTFRGGWIPEIDLPLGYVDDGASHDGSTIHSWRLPTPAGAPRLICHDVKVLHYQYTDWQRMKSKHRWYQCWERLNSPQKSAIDIFRQYHHMYAIPEKDRVTMQREWLAGYQEAGIDMTSVLCQADADGAYPWDLQIAEWLVEHGPEKFSRLDIWQMDYEKIWLRAHTGQALPRSLKDPRSAEEKAINEWLRSTQAIASTDASVKQRDSELRASGW